ncbi:hypothetical protein [Flavobacterium cerinum]|uniref:Uncharacterized protein n=1 Tax=Flavobacterium cerinum TaxID=2502784 RepID=A0A444H8W4_9FLAO|nr:hypothetical protein [Flavobacterium cerinum]RWW99714.1 hypothetical protein EPI11_12235 [Flavobacterium cerinum]
MDFISMDIATVTHSITGSGVRYLELFLQEYTSIFKEKVNPACPKCLTEYLTRYKNHYKAMANTSHYRLHAKYENIPLEFGSPILVNNGNITNEYAQQLLLHKNGERYFAQIPTPPVKKAKQDKKKDKPLTNTPDISVNEITNENTAD